MLQAESVDEDEICGNGLIRSRQIGARDAVTRSLLVEPEGREQEYTHSSFVCPGGMYSL